MSSEEIDSLKTNPGVLRLWGQHLKLRKEGDKYFAICPFHSEKSGSFCVHSKDLLGHCYGCGITLNIFQYLEKTQNCSFKEAVAKVRDFLGENNWEKSAAAVDQVFRPAVESQKIYKTYTLEEYAGFEKALAQNEAAKSWLLNERGITYETAKKLRFGFRRDIGRLAGEKNADIADKGWLAFPCLEDDRVVSIKYRSIVRKAFCKQPGMATVLFNTDAIDLFAPVMVVEGELDVAALTGAGFNAVSLPSASTGLTPQMKDQIMRAESVILAGDSDEVGSAAMTKLWRELSERTYLLHWPPGVKDANEFFLGPCRRDVSIFRTTVGELVQQARTQPMADIYSLQEVMVHGTDTALKDRPDRLEFPWKSVDDMAILLPGDVATVFATQTGTGKSAWVMNLTVHNAMKKRKTILNLQTELNTEAFSRMVAAFILKKHRTFLTKSDFAEAADLLGDVKYYVGYDPSISTVDAALDLVEAAIKRLSVDIVCIDHIHFLCRNETNEVSALANAMQRIKRLADKYRVVMIVVGQPRKPAQQNRGKAVQLSDAKGSETFASDSSATYGLHRDILKPGSDEGPMKDNLDSKTKVLLLKARMKGEGNAEANLLFLGEMATFTEIDYRHEEPSEDPYKTM